MSSDRTPPPGRVAPTKHALRNNVLWCARWLLGDEDGQYRGRLRVDVTAVVRYETLTISVESARGANGLGDPEPMGGIEPIGPSVPDILRTFLSRDEVRILQALAGHEPSRANDVLDRCKVEKSKFWVLWSNLQQRSIVGDAEEGEGFVILSSTVRDMVAGGDRRPAG